MKDRYTHLSKLLNQGYNINQDKVILRQGGYEIHQPFQFKVSEDKTELCAVKSKIR